MKISVFPKILLTTVGVISLSMSPSMFAADNSREAAVDNTKRNDRDASGETKTPGDQSNSDQDIQITKSIRQTLVKDDSLSTNAKNVKIITVDGNVTLRGPVNNQNEKSLIEKAAKQAAGKGKVENQLEVKNPQ